MIRKLKIKIVTTVMSIVTVLLIAIIIFAFFLVRSSLYNESISAMRDYAAGKAETERDFDRFFGEESDEYSLYKMFRVDYFPTVFGSKNVLVPHGLGDDITDEEKEFIRVIAGNALSSEKSIGNIKEYNLRFLKVQAPDCTKIVFFDKAYEDSYMRKVVFGLISTGFACLVAFFGISLLLCRIAVDPVERSWKQQKQLIADVSHELKTPLAVISANADIIAASPESTIDEQSEKIEYIRSETAKMNTLIGNMLYLAKSDEAVLSYEKEELDLSELVLGAALPLESVCFERGVLLNCNIEPDIRYTGNHDLLNRLTVILIDNARKFSVQGGTVNVDLYRSDSKIILAVNNRGPVISPEQMKHIFERFYRTDESRSHEISGFGLGLSIAKSITDIHGGKIDVFSNEKDGTTFVVAL